MDKLSPEVQQAIQNYVLQEDYDPVEVDIGTWETDLRLTLAMISRLMRLAAYISHAPYMAATIRLFSGIVANLTQLSLMVHQSDSDDKARMGKDDSAQDKEQDR